MKIENVKVYGLENAIRCSKFPMQTDISELPNNEYISYWLNQEPFLREFDDYQKYYGKYKGKNTPESCCFCGDSNCQRNNGKGGGRYYCAKHNHQIERYGEVFETSPKYSILNNGIAVEIVGDERKTNTFYIDSIDLPYVFKQKLHFSGDYVCDELGVGLHCRLIDHGDNELIDHEDRNPANNRRSNLRRSSRTENNRNASLSKNNTSGVSGVSFSKSKNKWRSYINLDYKQKFLGYYNSFDDAVRARLVGEIEYYGDFAPQKHLFSQYGIEYNNDNVEEKSDYNLAFNKVYGAYHRARALATSKAGAGDDNFLNGIIVQFDLTFSNKAWVELQRYHFIDFISSQSTMHRITKFNLDEAYNEYVDTRIIEIMKELVAEYNNKELADRTAEDYLRILYSNPAGFELTAGMTTNYRQLKTIYKQRKAHRLPEWREFCNWLKKLPNSEWITGENNE